MPNACAEGFRAKVEILRQQIDRARKVPLSRVRDKDEFHIKVFRVLTIECVLLL